jgi:hypothetical protein
VQERPDELARDVLETELEIRVLIDRVMTGIERQRADRVPLLVGDLGLSRSRAVNSRSVRLRSPRQRASSEQFGV